MNNIEQIEKEVNELRKEFDEKINQLMQRHSLCDYSLIIHILDKIANIDEIVLDKEEVENNTSCFEVERKEKEIIIRRIKF